jgi:hypothetical protein
VSPRRQLDADNPELAFSGLNRTLIGTFPVVTDLIMLLDFDATAGQQRRGPRLGDHLTDRRGLPQGIF